MSKQTCQLGKQLLQTCAPISVPPDMIRGATAEDVAALRESGITVDNEDPDEANIAPPPAQPIQGTSRRPAICARRARPSLSDFEDGWKNYAWNAIMEQTYFDRF